MSHRTNETNTSEATGHESNAAGVFDKYDGLTADEKARANNGLKIALAYANPIDGISALQSYGRARRIAVEKAKKRSLPSPEDRRARPTFACDRPFSFSLCDGSSDLDLVGRVNVNGSWVSLPFFALASCKGTAVLTTEIDGVFSVACCSISALPASTAAAIIDVNHSDENEAEGVGMQYDNVASAGDGHPCRRNGANAVFISEGKLKGRFVDQAMWNRIVGGQIQVAISRKDKRDYIYRYAEMNFFGGSELDPNQVFSIDPSCGTACRSMRSGPVFVLDIARKASLASRVVSHKISDMLDHLERLSYNDAPVKKTHHLLQLTLRGDPAALMDRGKFIPCAYQIQYRNTSMRLGATEIRSWSLTPCACDVDMVGVSNEVLGELHKRRKGKYRHESASQRYGRAQPKRRCTD